MNTKFKSALNQIYAETALISKTESALNAVISGEKRHVNLILPVRRVALIVCMLIVTMGSSFGAYKFYKTPINYLSIDINPSIELGVNVFGLVVDAYAFNDEGAIILNEASVNGKNVENSVKAVVIAAANNGYISDDGNNIILITTEVKGNNSDTFEQLEERSENGLIQGLNEVKKTAIIQQERTTLKIREEAYEYGISSGKLNLINQLNEMNQDKNTEAYMNMSIREMIGQIKSETTNENQFNENREDNKENSNEMNREQNTERSSENTTSEYTEANTEQNNNQNRQQNSGQATEENTLENTEQNTEQHTVGKPDPSEETEENIDESTSEEATSPNTSQGSTEHQGQENSTGGPNTSESNGNGKSN